MEIVYILYIYIYIYIFIFLVLKNALTDPIFAVRWNVMR
jgi:hypothetical protein